MNATTHKSKNGKTTPPPQGLGLELEPAGDLNQYHERELRSIAAFRLRDAANRIALLVSMTRCAELRAELLDMYDRLMSEERELLVRSMRLVHVRRSSAVSRVAKRTA